MEIELGPLIVKLSAMFGASVLIERFLVIVNGILNRLFIIQSSIKNQEIDFLNGQMDLAVQASLEERILNDPEKINEHDGREIEPNPALNIIESNFDLLEIIPLEDESHPEERFKILRKMNKVRKEFWMQLFGTVIGIIACYYAKFSIWIFVTSAIQNRPPDEIEPQMWEFFFTGIIIGSSSKPINFLMNFLINRKIEIKKKEVKEKFVSSSASTSEKEIGPFTPPPVPLMKVKPMTIEEIVGFTYDGGDKPERLENTHLFKSDVDLIVFHHTAMHSDTPFEGLVKEFDKKGWLTGYNCVVFHDGTIRTLCRWDRFGNHALPHNGHSLGIALQGNFETDSSVPYSNHDGSYGIKAPTSKQIDGMARITALWSLMHKIDPKFPSKASSKPKYIVPHNLIANKACPGSNFPYKTFQRKVEYYHQAWKTDTDFNQALEEFKEMSYVMPKKSK